ncbi:MAG: hypothetical protein EXS13_13350 [Planctomycetes bacterium]|nr:hypothetical protein [Planctomycetota bacterium]
MTRSKCALVISVFAVTLAAAPLQDAPPQAAPAPIERNGTFVPAEATEVKLELEGYQGGLKLVEVVAHGTPVRGGEVIARFKLDDVDGAIAAAERDLRSTEIRHQNQREQARTEQEAADQRLADAIEAVEKAEQAQSVYEKTEIELKRRGVELNDGYTQDGLEDQKDELSQLEKMYTADELTDATEEIVLKRSRRQLARSLASYEIQKARRRLDEEVSEPEVAKAKKRAVRDAKTGRDRLARQLEMEKRSRDDGLVRLEPEMGDANERVAKLRRDRERMVVRAAKDGIVLHGAMADYEPGRGAARHQVDAAVGAGATLFTLAQPGALAVALDLPESQVLKLDQNLAVKVIPAADAARTLVGRLRYERFPDPRSASGAENSYEATVELDGAMEPSFVVGMRCKIVIELPKRAGS